MKTEAPLKRKAPLKMGTPSKIEPPLRKRETGEGPTAARDFGMGKMQPLRAGERFDPHHCHSPSKKPSADSMRSGRRFCWGSREKKSGTPSKEHGRRSFRWSFLERNPLKPPSKRRRQRVRAFFPCAPSASSQKGRQTLFGSVIFEKIIHAATGRFRGSAPLKPFHQTAAGKALRYSFPQPHQRAAGRFPGSAPLNPFHQTAAGKAFRHSFPQPHQKAAGRFPGTALPEPLPSNGSGKGPSVFFSPAPSEGNGTLSRHSPP